MRRARRERWKNQPVGRMPGNRMMAPEGQWIQRCIRRKFFRCLLIPAALVFLAFSGSATLAQSESALDQRADKARAPTGFGPDPGARKAIEDGLQYLRGQQLGSGAIGGDFPVAVTSLSGLAMLGAGHRYRHGEHSKTLQGILRYLENSCNSSGYISDDKSRMHGHCYAILFLTQLFGELPRNKQGDVEKMIRSGVRVIVRSQSRLGGWYYEPDDPLASQKDEASITICALQALRAANGIGFSVPKSVVEKATEYVKRCKSSDGSFRYSLTLRDEHTSYCLTVAAISTLNMAGVYNSPEIEQGLDFARRRLSNYPTKPWNAAEKEFFLYGNYYAAQAFYQSGEDIWNAWYPPVKRYLLERQRDRSWGDASGSWSDKRGTEYGTAMALLILEIPLNYLPIYQR